MDFIKGGLQIHCTIAIDFTGSLISLFVLDFIISTYLSMFEIISFYFCQILAPLYDYIVPTFVTMLLIHEIPAIFIE